MPEVILFSTDLLLTSSVSGAARSAGLDYRTARSASELTGLSDDSGSIVCCDLNVPGLNLEALANSLPPRTLKQAIAFGPHVHAAKLAHATECGFGAVISRGQFVSKLSELLSQRSSVGPLDQSE
jgi:hypothetical protein